MSSRNRRGGTAAATAARAIARLTEPGDLVIDPMCGRGDVLVEAVLADRMAVGVEAEKAWADTARDRIGRLTESCMAGFAAVAQGRPEDIRRLLGEDAVGRARLILTSPHGDMSVRMPGLQASATLDDLGESLVGMLDACAVLLRPDGLVAVAAWLVRHQGQFVDIPALVESSAARAGFQLHDRVGGLFVFDRAVSVSTNDELMRTTGPVHDELVLRRPDGAGEGGRHW